MSKLTAIFLILFISGCDTTLKKPANSIEQLVAKIRLNLADYEINSVYETCPNNSKYLVSFEASVQYYIDLEKKPLTFTKKTSNDGYIINSPAIQMSNKPSSPAYARHAWTIEGSIFVNDTAEAQRQKDHVEAYALHRASEKLGTNELKIIFSEKIKQLVNAISIGVGNEIKINEMTVVFDDSENINYPNPIKKCEDHTHDNALQSGTKSYTDFVALR